MANGILWQLAGNIDPLGRYAQGLQQHQKQQTILQQLAGQEADRQFNRERDTRNFDWQQQEAQRNQGNWEKQFGQNAANQNAMRSLQQQQFELQKAQFNRKEDPEKVRLAKAAGLTPGTPEFQQFVLGEQQKLGSADKKAIFDAEDQLAPLKSQADALRRALELNEQTFTGIGSRLRGNIGTSVPGGSYIVDPNKAGATREFDTIMSLEAIKSMSENLKGASTDRELFEFQRILSDPTTPPPIRKRVIERMLNLTERQAQIKQNRMEQLRGNTYFKPQGTQPQQPNASGGNNAPDPLGIR